MTPFEIIKDAYDAAGIGHVVKEKDSRTGKYFYIITCDPDDVLEFQKMDVDEVLYKSKGYMEFYEDGSIASY